MNEVDSGCINMGKNELLPYNFLCINWLTLWDKSGGICLLNGANSWCFLCLNTWEWVCMA